LASKELGKCQRAGFVVLAAGRGESIRCRESNLAPDVLIKLKTGWAEHRSCGPAL